MRVAVAKSAINRNQGEEFFRISECFVHWLLYGVKYNSIAI